MKFTLNFNLDTDAGPVDSAAFLRDLDAYRSALTDIALLEGRIVMHLNGEDVCGEYSDPLVRLIEQWLRKLPWVMGGDTETVVLRNSEHCFAFVPAAESVELSYFIGTETEVEDYIVPPTPLRLDAFVHESIQLGDRLLDIIQKADPSWLESHEDGKDLLSSSNEAKRVWREYQVHLRR